MTCRSQADPSDRVRGLEAEVAALRWLAHHCLKIEFDGDLFDESSKAAFFATWYSDEARTIRTETFPTEDDALDAAVRRVRKEQHG